MEPKTLKAKAKASPLTRDIAEQKPVYSVITNSTNDGLCYNAVRAQSILEKSLEDLLRGIRNSGGRWSFRHCAYKRFVHNFYPLKGFWKSFGFWRRPAPDNARQAAPG